MSFFGFEQNDLEQDKRNVLNNRGPQGSEDLAVYTWGEESYDGLGDVLQEGGDELNDETFGTTEPVGKDFDFSYPALPDDERTPHGVSQAVQNPTELAQKAPTSFQSTASRPSQPPRSTTHSLEAIWDDKSPFSVLSRFNGSNRASEAQPSPVPRPLSQAKFSPFSLNESPVLSQQVGGHGGKFNQSRVRTLPEIEAEMLAAARQTRMAAAQQNQEMFQRKQQEEQKMRLLQEQELQRQQRLYQQEQQQQQIHMNRLLQQQQQQQRTPPPRMLPVSHSPRFLENQRHILLLQQQQEQQQQLQLQELQEQLRFEELERQMAAQLRLQEAQSSTHTRRQQGALTPVDIQTLQQQQRNRHSQSPGMQSQHPNAMQEPYLPHNIQHQQRVLSEMAQADFMREMQGTNQAEQEALRAEAMRKIVEAEKMEEKRRRKAAKIAHMARYNDLMTQSDKDFITRIQVSQLVTQDPYADDFYAQVYGAILRSRMGLQSQDERVIKFGAGGGIGLGLAQKGGNRRPSAMQRMEQQVERIVSNARKREEEKGLHSLHSLQGALGKTSGRSYKAAPRQLLQVDSSTGSPSPTLAHAHAHISKAPAQSQEGAAREAAKLGREALGNATDTQNVVRQDPLSRREVLVILEKLYDLVLQVEQLRRDQPSPEDELASQEWQMEFERSVDLMWDELRVMVPVYTSDPHPFISLLGPSKGKKILPRVTRHLSSARMLTLLTLLVACFGQLDVVKQAPILDSPIETSEREDVERQTQAFLGSVMQSILPVVSTANLRLITGLLSLLLHRTNIVAVAQTRPGLALLTLFLSRVEVIKQTTANTNELTDIPTAEENQKWTSMFNHLFELLAPHLIYLFPSSRIPSAHLQASGNPADIADQPVWQFLAALALSAVVEQHELLVTTLREKVLDNILSVNKGWVANEEERQTKLANVNLFLHALGLDSSQVAM